MVSHPCHPPGRIVPFRRRLADTTPLTNYFICLISDGLPFQPLNAARWHVYC
jgi:hypothetical protein